MTVKRNSDEFARRARIAHGAGAAVGAFIITTLGLAIAMSVVGAGNELVQMRAADSSNALTLTSQAAFGVSNAILGMVVGMFSLAGATLATAVSMAIGALGLALGLIIAVGVITGPLLMVGAIVVLVRRRYFPDVI